MVLEKIPFNVRSVIEDCIKSHVAKAVQKRIDLRFQCEASPHLDVLGDPLRVRQIVANLLSNAIKFTDHGWICVTLSADRRADGRVDVKLQVTDTGTGIPADKLPAIFEKFTQADGSITRRYGGTGLGLAITQRLVDMHGGEIRVESEVGKGSTFSVTLLCEAAPAVPKAQAPQKIEMAPDPLEPPSGARLLVVEDNLVNQKVVLAVLRKKGFRLEVANDGREALAKLEAPDAAYDLVLMDVQMPVLDGLEATRCIRRNPRWNRLPIVAMTAHAMNGDRERCLEAGMDAYISKPVQPAHLIATIEKHLAASRTLSGHEALDRISSDRPVADPVTKHDTDRSNDVLQLFLQVAPERLRKLEIAAGRSDTAALQLEAQLLGAAADHLASSSVGACARRIEQAAAHGDLEQVRQNLDALRREFHSLEALAT